MQGLTNTNSAIQSNRQMWERLSKSNAFSTKPQLQYSSSEVQYYNDEVDIKKKKRRKISKWLTLGFTGISIVSIAATFVTAMIKGKIKPQKLAEQAQETAQSALLLAEKCMNFFGNLDAAKNECWQIISEKIHAGKFDEIIQGLFGKMSMAENKKIYDVHSARFNKYATKLGIDKLGSFDERYKAAGKDIQTALKQGGKVYQILFSGFKKTDDNSKISKRIINGIKTMWEKGSKSLLTDSKLKNFRTENGVINIYQKHAKGLNISGIGELSQDLYSLDASKKLAARNDLIAAIQKEIKDKNIEYSAEEIADDIIELNKVLTRGMKTSIEKQRDLFMKNASVDVLGMIGSAGILGGAVITADAKEEKEAITLDLGIPLLSSMAFSIIAGIKNIAGPVGAVIGLCFGQVISMTAKGIESIINKAKAKKETKQENLNA